LDNKALKHVSIQLCNVDGPARKISLQFMQNFSQTGTAVHRFNNSAPLQCTTTASDVYRSPKSKN